MSDPIQRVSVGGSAGPPVVFANLLPDTGTTPQDIRQVVEAGPRAVGRVIGFTVNLLEDVPGGKLGVGPVEHLPVKLLILAPATVLLLNRTRPVPLTGLAKFVYLFPVGVVFNALIDPPLANTIEEQNLAREELARELQAALGVRPMTPPMWLADP